MFLDVWLNLGQPEPSYFFFHPGFPRPSDTFSHTSRLSLLHSRSAFFIVAPLFYIPLHFNTYTLGNNPDSTSHKRKNDIYVQREGGKLPGQTKKKKKRVKWTLEKAEDF